MRAVVISDTYGQHKVFKLPKGTFLIHCGDFTNMGSEEQTDAFLAWFSEQPHKHKILISGNHDFFSYLNLDAFKQKCALLNIVYLQDSYITLEGIKFYGTPYVPQFYNWAFMEHEDDLVTIYGKIPTDTQVLLTHGPAYKLLDEVFRGHVGSRALAKRLPHLTSLTHHLCGHIHEDRGKLRGRYLTVNAASVDNWYNILPPMLINIKPNLSSI